MKNSGNKVELLAPAGNYESLIGAINAGADAVYLGGEKFGARAYAQNFTNEEICTGIRFAHLHDCKIYLTLNTLVKEKEFSEISSFLLPFYEAGLDGIIVQDMGVFSYVKEHFPQLELHVSTQMTITGSYGAELLKKEGAIRIVPAREISLEEIKNIKEKVDIEIEAFIHGALCYCYSGQCLFSSILGGRSGNRGRCAQPCRLPYKTENNRQESYPLSMKDLCTIEMIPQMIEAGIDSFKIEGRMKKPEYAAGVTSIYRKYIDKYYANPDKPLYVSDEDKNFLNALYIRSEVGQGYYFKHNGKEMITPQKPGYHGSDDELLKQIRRKYIEESHPLSIQAICNIHKGTPVSLQLNDKEHQVSVTGEIVDNAMKQPLTQDMVSKQLSKMGNTSFQLENLQIEMDEDCFLTVKALNELRRDAVTALENEILCKKGYANTRPYLQESTAVADRKNTSGKKIQDIHLCVQTLQQLNAALSTNATRVYIPVDLLLDDKQILSQLGKSMPQTEFFLAFPYILRLRDQRLLPDYQHLLENPVFNGVLIRNYESLEWLHKQQYSGQIVSDANLYQWNNASLCFWKEKVAELYLPYECNMHELKQLSCSTMKTGMIAYGRIPMMVTANCIQKTTQKCVNHPYMEYLLWLTDRYDKKFPVYYDCLHCYNIIYNTVPLSLHHLLKTIDFAENIRLDFTTETAQELIHITQFFEQSLQKQEPKIPYEEYTTGHYKRGVE